ncbi:TrkH family potassium uptake protein [Desulfurispirillum indicum]|uniref:TrkH family potassium uptake protein n=1 Tax=Desulfurispirillum indicum TaxID=936456 RepID=UPI0005A2D8EF|nr:TrkH family potassium uptake protein [Desulfurispirillum indicum]UCZ57781.1 TrkH family potassium uptake protein [Desulfurispirillum indicum]
MVTLKNLLKSLSVITFVMGCSMIFPVITGIVYDEPFLPFLLLMLSVLAVCGAILWGLRHHNANLNVREGAFVVTSIWLILGVVGALPFVFYGATPSFSDAVFETISGFTTTGASIMSDIEALPKMLLMWRSAMHWFGGMGIIVFSIAVLPMVGNGALQLIKAEGIMDEKLTPHIRDTAMALWKVYLAFTIANALLLYWAGMLPFDAINHAFSTIATGGFSTKNDSFGHYAHNDAIMWITIFFMVISGINYLAHFKLLKKDFSGYRTSEPRLYLQLFFAISLLAGLMIFLHQPQQLGFYESMKHSFFTIASIMTTTGFASIDYVDWTNAFLIFTILVMVIGGCAGSTAGGVKVIRYVVLFKALAVEIKRMVHPRGVYVMLMDNRKITSGILTAMLGFFALYFCTNAALTIYLSMRGLDLTTALSASLAMVGNVGPGLGLVGPMDNFSFMAWYDKLILSLAMVIGRLECYTFFLLLSRSFWKRF